MTPVLRHGEVQALGTAAAALLALGFALAVGIDPLMTGGPTGVAGLLGILVLALGGIALAVLLLRVEPAWPLSLGVAAMIFGGWWPEVGSPFPLDRVLFGLGLLSLVLRARAPRDVLGREPSGIHLLLVCVALYGVSSAVLAGTIGEHDAQFALLDRYGIVPFILFAVAPAAFPGERERRILLGILTVVGAYIAYTSILGWLGPRSLVWPTYIVDPAIGIHADRARGPFAEAGADGMALFECGIAALILAGMRVDRRVAIAAVAIAGACALAIMLTFTRAVWLGSSLGLIVALLATRQGRRYVGPAVLGAFALVMVVFAVVPGFSGEASSRANDDRPIWDRKNTNYAALRMIEDRPLVGFGWNRYEAHNADYQRLGADYPITRRDAEVHNVFLSNAVELGLIGTLLWACALAIAVGGAFAVRGPPEMEWWRVGMIAIAAQWFVVANFAPLGFGFSNALLWLWAGILWGSRGRELSLPRVSRRPQLEYAAPGR